MKISPIIENHSPQYPKENEIENISAILNNKKPARWKRNVAIGAILSGLIFSTLNTIDIIANSKKSKTPDIVSFVAPIFEHGRGIGSFGGMRASFPDFINESEAKQIIIESFRKENIELTADTSFNNLIFIDKLALIKEPKESVEIQKFKPKAIQSNLEFTLINKEKQIGIVYISRKNYHQYADDKISTSTVTSSNYKSLANKIVKSITNNKKNSINIAVFYEPTENEINKSKQSLKMQIQDFFKWLKKKNK
jgi:hypothetical protein